MPIKFILVANKQGQVRLSKYFTSELNVAQRIAVESEAVRKCISRGQNMCCFFNYENFKVVYRRYAALYFVVGVDDNENLLGIREFIHLMVVRFWCFTNLCPGRNSGHLLSFCVRTRYHVQPGQGTRYFRGIGVGW